MIIETYPVGILDTNCYLLISEDTREAVCVDPGGMTPALRRALGECAVRAIVLTHGHFDHFGGIGEIVKLSPAPVYIHSLDAPLLRNPIANGSYLMGREDILDIEPVLLQENDTIPFGRYSLTVRHTPGHSPGGICLDTGTKIVLAGDTLFRLSVGRWDLPGGDYDTLTESILRVFQPLSDDVAIYPGHGQSTTVGFEKHHNPFLRGC